MALAEPVLDVPWGARRLHLSMCDLGGFPTQDYTTSGHISSLILALMQIRKLSEAASELKVAPTLRVALIHELLRAFLCCEETLQPFLTVLPGETEIIMCVPYLMGLVLDWGEVVVIASCGGDCKGCTMCTCAFANLGGPVSPGCCTGSGRFRDGAATAAWAAQMVDSGNGFSPVSRADEQRYRNKPVKVCEVVPNRCVVVYLALVAAACVFRASHPPVIANSGNC